MPSQSERLSLKPLILHIMNEPFTEARILVCKLATAVFESFMDPAITNRFRFIKSSDRLALQTLFVADKFADK